MLKLFKPLFLIPFLFGSCQKQKKNRIIVEAKIDSLNNGKIVVWEYESIFKNHSDTLLKKITSLNNVNDDYKTFLLSGISSLNGLTPWLIDSFYYNVGEYDTVRVNYKNIDSHWVKNQVFKYKYDINNNLIYTSSERLYNQISKAERFYMYNKDKQITSMTLYECGVTLSGCDSIYKDLYYYNSLGQIDSSEILVWKKNRWEKH